MFYKNYTVFYYIRMLLIMNPTRIKYNASIKKKKFIQKMILFTIFFSLLSEHLWLHLEKICYIQKKFSYNTNDTFFISLFFYSIN